MRWSQSRLAKEIGITQSTLAKIERGDSFPSHQTAEKIQSMLEEYKLLPEELERDAFLDHHVAMSLIAEAYKEPYRHAEETDADHISTEEAPTASVSDVEISFLRGRIEELEKKIEEYCEREIELMDIIKKSNKK